VTEYQAKSAPKKNVDMRIADPIQKLEKPISPRPRQDASGLRINYGRCSITPIFGDEEGVQAFRAILQCPIKHFPITYLGAPLSPLSLPKSQYGPLIEKLVARLPELGKGHS
jgi:hypothetical protein